ncbi:hypothetical protein Cme02nite_14750 [Catellatospora methionotrophica]|uniref:Uncharacterized protein n=1 Tax=Catellatospora methionotrophica TaxID=121620 RepID=A0A8J3PEA6_9ACTN|nr:hypothetical protein Cme02nite_14750 [Catellatospora methionotrophica]
MTEQLTYELPDDHPDPQVGDVLRVPHYLVDREPVLVAVRTVNALLSLQPPAWWVHGMDRAGYGVRVYVHRQHPQRAAKVAAVGSAPLARRGAGTPTLRARRTGCRSGRPAGLR